MPAPSLVPHPSLFTAYGVDGCSAGWLFVALGPSERIRWGVVPTINDLVKDVCRPARIFIDIPIGLPEGAGRRACDEAARKVLGPRRSSVFSAPVREVLAAASYGQANRISNDTARVGMSRQAFAIAPKIREVDCLLRRDPAARDLIREVHPEVCFWALAGCTPMTASKKIREGYCERVLLLQTFRPTAAVEVLRIAKEFSSKEVAWDDIPDAFVAALTASQDTAVLRTLPEVPVTDRYDLPMEMVYADGSAIGTEMRTAR